jgi:hypothetical protein
MALLLAGCASTSQPGSTGATGPASPSPATLSASPTQSVTATPSAAGAASPSAAGQLQTFFAAAQLEDTQLRAAAVLVNDGFGATSISLSPSTKAAVTAIDPTVVARTIPAGLGPSLQLAVLVVYSDLRSRRDSMNRVASWASSPGTTVMPAGGAWAKDLLTCLRNGASASAGFPRDLAAARALARRASAFTPASPRSRAAGELAVRIRSIYLDNAGCAACGGGVVTRLASVTWRSMSIAGYHWDGVVEAAGGSPSSAVGSASNPYGGIPFRAYYVAGKGWQVSLDAC